MKKTISVIVISLLFNLVTGCAFVGSLLDTAGIGNRSIENADAFASPYDKPQVVCTYFPYYRSDTLAQWVYGGLRPNSEETIGPEPWRRELWIGRTGDYPYIGMYNNVTDPEIMRWHIRLAKAAGISAFLLYVYNWEEQRTETQIMLDVADQENFKVAFVEHHSYLGATSRNTLDGQPFPIMSRKYVGYDQIMEQNANTFGLPLAEKSTRYIHPAVRSLRSVPLDALQQAGARIAAMLNAWKDHPAYYHVDDKPMIVIPYIDANLEPGDFQQLVEHIEAEVGQDVYVVAVVPQVYWYFYPPHVLQSGITKEWAKTGVAAFTHWTPNGMVTASQKMREDVVNFHVKDSVAKKKDPMIPVMPGFDDDAWEPGDSPASAAPRKNGDAWRDQLKAAVAAKPRFLFIQSWNEWYDGTQIEPSTSYSDQYLYLKILAHELGKPWQTPPLPHDSSLDPLRIEYLPH